MKIKSDLIGINKKISDYEGINQIVINL
jgi:hypothetical protein